MVTRHRFMGRLIAVAGAALATVAVLTSGSGKLGAAVPSGGPTTRQFHYQGRLTGPGGPIDGIVDLRVQLWDAPTGGSAVGSAAVFNDLVVSGGLVDVSVPVPADAFVGEARWIGLAVDGQELTPRQPIRPTAYALGLLPGARVESEDPLPALVLVNRGTGAAVSAFSQSGQGMSVGSADGIGLMSTAGLVPPLLIQGPDAIVALGQEHGVHAWGGMAGVHGTGSTGVRGEGDVGVSGTGITGVAGASETDTGIGVSGSATGLGGSGVSGESALGPGVTGTGETGLKGTGTVGPGVDGRGPIGVFGGSDSGEGVVGNSQTSAGVYGNGTDGVFGEGVTGVRGKSGDPGGQGLLGEGTGTATEGVVGSSVGPQAIGVYGISSGPSSVAVWGLSSGTYGFATEQSIYVGGSCVGCVAALIARNTGPGALLEGQVVAITGVEAPLGAALTPILLASAAGPGTSGVLGVVRSRAAVTHHNGDGDPTARTSAEATPGKVAQGELMVLVMQGLARVRTSTVRAASAGAALSVADGGAAAIESIGGGRILGRSLEPLPAGEGLVWAYILEAGTSAAPATAP